MKRSPQKLKRSALKLERRGQGLKLDGGKPRWSLMPWRSVGDVLRVLEFGAAKYAPDNWKKVPDARRRYYDATMRHMVAWWNGERNDTESGLPHLAHAACCLLFLAWFDGTSEMTDAKR